MNNSKHTFLVCPEKSMIFPRLPFWGVWELLVMELLTPSLEDQKIEEPIFQNVLAKFAGRGVSATE